MQREPLELNTEPPTDAQRARYAEAIDALNRGDWARAQNVAMHLLREVPPHAGVYFVAGVAARELLQIPLALECLRTAVELNPKRADYVAQLARALSQASEPGQALVVADKALALEPADAASLDTLGMVYTQVHDYAKAARMFGRVVEVEPGQARYRFNYATSLIHAGDIAGAERELEACLSLDPNYWKAYLSLAHLRRQTDSDNHLARLKEMLPRVEGDTNGELFVNLALSKEYEDLGAYPEAFDHLVAGKSAVRRTRDYDSSADAALFAAIRDASPLRADAADGCASEEPIFVMGMPRTGTTLIERIISSHPDVYSAGELQNFGVALKRASGSRTQPMLDIDTIQRSSRLDWRSLGQKYLDSTRPATAHHARFIDKLPHNFLFAGFIAAALPKARLICLRRDPMDTCLSNFRQLFSLNSSHYNYSLDLLDTGRYYVEFDRLMAFWRQHLPGRILEIDYETVVENQEATTRKLLDFCGLSWNDACLNFQDNAAPVATASAVQVREPVYRSAMKRWKRYEAQLSGLRTLLVESGIPVSD